MDIRKLVKQNRKNMLDPLARTYGICTSSFKNKELLVNEIVNKINLPRSKRCYNENDPCSLENIDDISDQHYVEWIQHESRFGADIRSITTMFANKQYMLPWALDFVSSYQLQTAEAIEEHKQKYDMRNVPEFKELLTNTTECTTSANNECIEMEFETWFIHELEGYCGDKGYVTGHIINNILSESNVNLIFERIATSLYTMLFHLNSDTNYMIHDVFYQYVYLQYTIRGYHIHDKEEHLRFFLNLLKHFIQIFGEEGKSIIHIVILDL